MSGEYLAFVNADDLEHLQQQVCLAKTASGASSMLLLDISGVVLACAGEPPLHPAQMGAMAAGMFAAMQAITSTTGADVFTVCVPSDNLFIEFLRVNDRLILLAISDEPETAVGAMRDLAPLAVNILSGAITRAHHADLQPNDADAGRATLREVARNLTSADFIARKLDELFQQK